MARFLVYTSPARGHLYPVVDTLLDLRQRGHEVHVRTLASEIGTLRTVGLHAAAIDPAIEAVSLEDWRGSTPEESLGGVFQTFHARSEHEVPDLQSAIADVEPDCLVVDVTTPGAAAVAEAGTIPWAQWIPFFQHVALAPNTSPELTLIPYTIAPPGLEVLNAPRRRLDLEPLLYPLDAWRAPLYLYYTAEPFEAEGLNFPASFRLVGPGLWEPAAEAPDWLDNADQPLVLVTASSEFQRDHALIETRSQQHHDSTECDDRAVATARGADRTRRLRRMPRRNGHHPTSPRSRNARLRRTVRTRPIRGRKPGHRYPLRHPSNARRANAGDPPRGDQAGNDPTPRGAASRLRLQARRGRPSGRKRPRNAARPGRPPDNTQHRRGPG